MICEKPLVLEYVPIPSQLAEEARRMMHDAFGHALRVQTTMAPCRLCLRISREPEQLILLSYRPLADTGPYAEIGPIFIHANGCEPYASSTTFPEDFLARSLVMRAYDADGSIVDAAIAAPGIGPEVAARFLSDSKIVEVHVRHTTYTCYDFKIVRASG